mgnify:FL=1
MRTRIAAVKSIKKITSTMKLVAASKLSKAQQKLEKTKPYTTTALKFMENEFPVQALNEEGKESEMNEFQIETLQRMKGRVNFFPLYLFGDSSSSPDYSLLAFGCCRFI